MRRRGAAIIVISLVVVLAGALGSAATPSGSTAGNRPGRVGLPDVARYAIKIGIRQPRPRPRSGGQARPGARASSGGCRLTVGYEGTTSGLGNVWAYFRIGNRGRMACRLRRYPLVTLIGAHGRPLTAHERPTDFFGPRGRRVRTLVAGAGAHFLIVFRPSTPGGGRRCAPAAVAALVRLTLTGASTARAALPTRLGKLHEPVNPCPRATFSVTRVTAGG